MEENKQFAEITEYLCKILTVKNIEYGDSVFTPPPFAPNVSPAEAILVRLGDKFKRLQSQTLLGSNLTDTILDIAGYCCLYLSLQRQNKEKV